MKALVGIIMGSKSDWDTMRKCVETLEELGVPCETRVVSAHRTPDLLFEYCASARDRGLEVIVAGAGGAAHLPGMAAAKTALPVLGVPVQSRALNGLDSLLSIVQMPRGIPVGTLAIGASGACNAGLLAAAILANKYPAIRDALDAFRAAQTQTVLDGSDPPQLIVKIGIIGAGQLGRMLALAGYPLGLRFLFLDTAADSPGGQVADIVLGPLDSLDGIAHVAAACDVVTVDVENVPAGALVAAGKDTTVWPPVAALETAQDRLSEKTLFAELGIPTPTFQAVDSVDALREAVAHIGLPAVLKTRRLGYDGRGQIMLDEHSDLAEAWNTLARRPMIVEQRVPFDFEVSLIGARSAGGETVFYPLSHNTHEAGILRHSVAPMHAPELEAVARDYVGRILARFGYVGVLTVEFFVHGNRLIANEIAPRVHNSGHWTIEGAVTSQFENHLRAITGLPLGDTTATGHSAMVNFIGTMPPRDGVLAIRGAHYHDYGKTSRPLRKLGHGTVVKATADQRDAALAQVLALADAGSTR